MHKLTIKNNISNLDNIAGFVEQFCTEYDLIPKTCCEINLVLDELVTNTIHYGYTDDNIHEIEISLEKQDDRVLIKLIDDAKEFNPLKKEEVDIKIEPYPDGYLLRLYCPTLVKGVKLSTDVPGTFLDNYFDLMPFE